MAQTNDPLRFRAAQLFHRHVTVWRFLALLVFCVILLFIITIPATVASLRTQEKDHRALAMLRAEDLAAFMDEQFIRMAGTVSVIHGFIASAAPLQVPNYFVDDAAVRVNKALRTATPGALLNQSFARVNHIVKISFLGYVDLVVQPGLVSVFASEGSSAVGEDVFSTQFLQYGLMVNTSSDLVRLPINPGNDTNLLILRAVIFDSVKNVSRNPNDLDPVTGRHVNWNHLWGGLSVIMNISFVANTDDMATRSQPDRFHWMFESEATTLSTFEYPDVVLRATEQPAIFRKRDASRFCCLSPRLESLCFSVMPRARYWDGERVPETIAFLVAVEIVGVLLGAGLLLGAVRLIVGAKRDPLEYAPTKTPLHAICVDLHDANRMWGEVPFIMHELTTTFTRHLEATAAEHRVFVTMRLGCTAIAVTSSRDQALAFARAMAEWGHTFVWPPHIVVHCPRGVILFSIMLHTMENVTVRIDREQDQCDVTGPDIKALLLLRVAAVEQHVICTGEFLGLPSLNPAQRSTTFASQQDSISAWNQDALASMPTADGDTVTLSNPPDYPLIERTCTSKKTITADIITLVGLVGELGVCQLPIPSVGPVTNVRGFLLTSHATAGRTMDEVLDTFPDEVWAEWKSGRAFDDAGFENIPSIMLARNPLRTADIGSISLDRPAIPASPLVVLTPLSSADVRHAAASDRASRTTEETTDSSGGDSTQGYFSGGGTVVTASSSKTAQMGVSDRESINSAHLRNESASRLLGGAAVDLFDVRRLATALLPVVGRSADIEGFAPGESFRGYKSVPTVMTLRSQASLEEQHGTLLAALSVSTYFFVAYRIVFAPLEPEVRQAMVTRICAAVGVPAEDYSFALAVRCTRLSMRYIDHWTTGRDATNAASAAAVATAAASSAGLRLAAEHSAAQHRGHADGVLM